MEPSSHGISWNQVQQIINEIRPAMKKDGGDCELVDVTADGIVKLRLIGACGKCPLSFMTLTMGIETRLKASIPAITKVVSIEDASNPHTASSPGLLKVDRATR
jgi:Fe-S cluster biogenesis protein NfuA